MTGFPRTECDRDEGGQGREARRMLIGKKHRIHLRVVEAAYSLSLWFDARSEATRMRSIPSICWLAYVFLGLSCSYYCNCLICIRFPSNANCRSRYFVSRKHKCHKSCLRLRTWVADRSIDVLDLCGLRDRNKLINQTWYFEDARLAVALRKCSEMPQRITSAINNSPVIIHHFARPTL